MKRVLIVDDEQPMVMGLSLIIKRYFSQEYIIVGTAASGREAVECDAELNPDILLMDVQMPGISGLEAIRTIARKGNPKAFILVTAYERFDIAREALSLGVCDYLLKPVSKDRLELALKVASDYLDRQNLLARRELELKETVQRLSPSLVRALFDLVEHGENNAEVALLAKTVGLNGTYGVMGIAVFLPANGDVHAMYHHFTDVLRYKSEALAGPLRDRRWCALLVPLVSESDTRSAAIHEMLKQSMPSRSGEEWLLYVGKPAPIEDLGRSFKEAFSVFIGGRQKEAYTPGESESIGGGIDQANAAFFLGLAEVIDQIRKNRFHAALSTWTAWIASMRTNLSQGSIPLVASETVLSLFASVLFTEGALSMSHYSVALDFEELRRLWETGATEAFARRCVERFDHLLQAVEKTKAYSGTVRLALHYIENHFVEQISLETAADAIGVSPGRLSRLMTEETGKGFARSLIECRMRRAKELLRTPGWSVRKVSEACGYLDPNYFARLFKKLTGESPSEYAGRVSAPEEDDDGAQ